MKLIVFAVFLSLPLFAQDSLSRKEAVARALRDHPLLDAAGRRVEAAQGLRTQAGLPLNPRLVLQSENTRPYSPFVYWRDTDNFAYLQQTFETAGKRDLRVAAAGSAVQRTEAERELLRRQIAARVATAYWAAVGAARLHQLLVESAANLQRVVEYHEVRVKEGAMAEADLIRVRLEAQRLNVDINHALLEAERARIHLQREMGLREFGPLRFEDTVEGALLEMPAGDVNAALSNRVEMRLAHRVADQARAHQALQLAMAKPNVDVIFGYKRTAGFDTMVGGVQMDLPFRNRNQGNISATAAEIRLAESNAAATEALIRAEYESAVSGYQLHRRDMVSYLQPLLEQAEETFRIADAAYREGGADLLRLLDAQRVRIEARIAYVRGLTEVREYQAALEAALGVVD